MPTSSLNRSARVRMTLARGSASGADRKSRGSPVRKQSGRAGGKTARPKIPSKTPDEPAVFVPPMKALSVETVPEGTWRSEVKLDGYRAVAVINGGEIQLWSRNRKLLTADYPEVVDAL